MCFCPPRTWVVFKDKCIADVRCWWNSLCHKECFLYTRFNRRSIAVQEQQMGAEGMTVALYLLWKSMSPRRWERGKHAATDLPVLALHNTDWRQRKTRTAVCQIQRRDNGPPQQPSTADLLSGGSEWHHNIKFHHINACITSLQDSPKFYSVLNITLVMLTYTVIYWNLMICFAYSCVES